MKMSNQKSNEENFFKNVSFTVNYSTGAFFDFGYEKVLNSDPDVSDTKLALDMLNRIGVNCK